MDNTFLNNSIYSVPRCFHCMIKHDCVKKNVYASNLLIYLYSDDDCIRRINSKSVRYTNMLCSVASKTVMSI